MLAKLSTFALALPLVSALTIVSITPLAPGQPCTVTWSASTTDPPTFSVELVNTIFNNQYAVANNVPTANGQLTITLPQVPEGGGYSMQLIAPNNLNDVYAQSGGLTVTAASSSSASAQSTSSFSASTVSSATSSDSFTTPSATTPASSASSVGTVSVAKTSSAASSTPSTFNSSGAASFKLAGVAPAAALVLSVVAGAAMVF